VKNGFVGENNSRETLATPKVEENYGILSPANQSTYINVEGTVVAR